MTHRLCPLWRVFLFVSFLLGSGQATAQAVSPLASGQLQVQGSRLTLYRDAQTNDADQTVNIGEAARIRTCYGGVCGTSVTTGLKAVGELRGPELPQPIAFETVPGGTFDLPGFQTEGEYFLENIRLVDAAGHVLGEADPSIATLHVRQILLASATVSSLSLAELQARGIVLTQQNYKAFKFAVGFAFCGTSGSQAPGSCPMVTIDLPVLYEGNGQVSELAKPTVALDGLPADVAKAAARWEPPRIVPFSLRQNLSPGLIIKELDEEAAGLPLFGAIVIPGNISFLNQFFDAKLIVLNGAPGGSQVTLDAITGLIRLPTGDVVRIAGTAPFTSPGQRVPVTRLDGSRALQPGQQGSASWTVEGLKTGTHALRIDILADLVRPGRETLALGGSTQAAVEVVDPRFHLTFNHPDTVRDGEAYTLYVTVTNLSRAVQQDITLRFDEITGAKLANPTAPPPNIGTLLPGTSETVEFQLVSLTTGKCFATTIETSSPSLLGAILLRTGVGELGIPLSPATLVLPRFSNLLPEALLKQNIRLLGLAYSLAVAPPSAAPAGLPHVVRADVERRAIDLGEAGQRLFLKDQSLSTLEVLALDQLGNRHDLAEYDSLRRSLEKGRLAGSALGDALRLAQASGSLSAVDLIRDFSATTSYAKPYVAALLVPVGGAPTPTLEVRKVSTTETTYLSYTTDETASPRLRSLPNGEVYSLSQLPTGGSRVPFALIGRIDPSSSYRVRLNGPLGSASDAQLVLLVPNDARDGFRRVDYGTIHLGPGEVGQVTVAKGAGEPNPTFTVVVAATGFPAAGAPAPVVADVPLPPFKVIGAVQDFVLDPHGLGLSYLFNRPPDAASAQTASSYRVRTSFRGADTTSPPQTVSRTVDKFGNAAFVQPNSERVVNVRYGSPISPLEGIFEGNPVIRHEHLLDTTRLRDPKGNNLDPAFPPVTVETDHPGGLVDGRVVKGTGDPVVGAVVQYLRWRTPPTPAGAPEPPPPVHDLVGEAVTDATGSFYFDFVQEPPKNRVHSGFQLRAIIPAGPDPIQEPAQVEEVASVIRLQNRIAHVNIALLGRGSVTGRLVYQDSQAPVPSGVVTAASTLFQEVKTATVDASGAFRFGGLPVGPLTLTGRDSTGNRVYATVGLEQPGQTRDILLQLSRITSPKTGTVTGRVLRYRSGSTTAEVASGATVAVYSNGAALEQKTVDGNGAFRFERVPEGRVTVQAADFSVSRTPAVGETQLAADQTATLTLTLAQASPRSVVGRVLFHDDATNTDVPVVGAAAFIEGPGVFGYTDAQGYYRIDDVPVQGQGQAGYEVTAIDFNRKLQGKVALAPVLDDPSGTPITAASIYLRRMTGGIDGIVLDPLGQPLANAGVVLYPVAETTTDAQGRFSFNDVGVGTYRLIAHVGDGLQNGRVGYFGAVDGIQIVFGGHRPLATIRMVGGGTVRMTTRTQGSSMGVRTPVYVGRIAYRDAVKDLAPLTTDMTTDDNGQLTVAVPVGGFSVRAVNPFHGAKLVSGTVEFPGQVIDLDIRFDTTSTVNVQVVDVDGVTPVDGFEVLMSASGFLPQRHVTDALGRTTYLLVPPGGIAVTASGRPGGGTIDRVGYAGGSIASGGQTLDLRVVLRAQGTVRGRVLQQSGGGPTPLANAQVYLQENGYPFRRLPASGFLTAGADGRFELSHIYAGLVSIVARDPNQVDRQGRGLVEITADFQEIVAPDIVLSTSVGSVAVTVRDPQSGAGVPDCQITLLNNGELTVSDSEGRVTFDAMPTGVSYSFYAFHAPTGRAGKVQGLTISAAGQRVDGSLLLESRGSLTGTLFDDAARTRPLAGGTIRLEGTVNGRSWGTSFTALASTDSTAGSVGRFLFDGIPVGQYSLAAAVPSSNRRGAADVTLTATAPTADLVIVLEPSGTLSVRLFEKLSSNPLSEINPATGVFAVRLTQTGSDFTTLSTVQGFPGHLFRIPEVLLSRPHTLWVTESSGEQRVAKLSGPAAGTGAGTDADPIRIVLSPKGVVRVTVRDASSNLVSGATVRIAVGLFGAESATDSQGRATFYGVPAGGVSVSAVVNAGGLGGLATTAIVFDDDVKDVTVALEPSVSVHGVVYHAPPNDVFNGDLGTLTREDSAIVQIVGGNQTQVVQTGSDGAYRFQALRTGAYTLDARSQDGQAVAFGSVSLTGPNGSDTELAPLILDAAAPRILSVVPSPGLTGVSRRALVEIVFSEPLLPAVTAALPSFFTVTGGSGAIAAGAWTTGIGAMQQQWVRFTPSADYENQSIHTIRILGGAGGVRDRVNRLLTTLPAIGSNFTTSDAVGASVIGTEPSLDRPVSPEASLRFDFNEILNPTPAELAGAFELSYQRTDSSWQVIPGVVTSLTRGRYSILVEPPPSVGLSGDTGRRRARITGLRDTSGNVMLEYLKAFRIYDANAPALAVGFPANAPEGHLSGGTSYTLTPSLTNLDDAALGGDVDRVEYFLASATDPNQPATTPAYVARTSPYAFGFVAAYSGDGATPRPFSVWAKATDTSTNPSNTVRVSMDVLPNVPPAIASVAVTALSPVAGTFYAGSTLRATVAGLSDADGAQLTLSAELRRENLVDPNSPADKLAEVAGVLIQRPAGGWQTLPPPVVNGLVVPLAQPEGTHLIVRARAVDSLGASFAKDSSRFDVADDATRPVIDAFFAHRPGTSTPVTSFTVGQQVVFDIRAHDVETAVQAVSISFNGVFAAASTATLVSGSTDTYRTLPLTVPFAGIPPAGVDVVATASVSDNGGNTATGNLTIHLGPSTDTTPPTATWVSPVEGGLWPASYTSVTPQSTGTALLLRVRAVDEDRAAGLPIPGVIVSVQVKGPADATGQLSATYTDATLVPGSELPGGGGGVYQALWIVPNGVAAGTALNFSVRVVDTGNNAVEQPLQITAQVPRVVYEGVQRSILAAEDVVGAESAPAFLLDGAVVSLYPHQSGQPRRFSGLHVYSGGALQGQQLSVRPSILTSPEITSYQSSVLYNPLEIQISQILALGHGSQLRAKGLLGGQDGLTMALPGETAAQPQAGGSHGGFGGVGLVDGTSRPGSVTDSVRDPKLPGGGGGAGGSHVPGGTGGGVVRILGNGTVRIEGEVAVDGADGADWSAGGGAGGAIRITANRIAGGGRLLARGGLGSGAVLDSGGGSGGRISISYAEPSSGPVTVLTDVRGGANSPSVSRTFGGAGTVYLEKTDASGNPIGPGKLVLGNDTARPAALTPLPGVSGVASGVTTDAIVASVDLPQTAMTLTSSFIRGTFVGDRLVAFQSDPSPARTWILPVLTQARVAGSSTQMRVTVPAASSGDLSEIDAAVRAGKSVTVRVRSRFAGVEARGATRLVVEDDLEIGAVDPAALNDRAALTLDAEARALLRGEAPQVAFSTTPPAGNVVPGAALSISYTATDPIGIQRVTGTWSVTGAQTTTSYDTEPTSVTQGATPISVTIPVGHPAGPVTYRVNVTDRAGRARETVQTWTVSSDATPPAIASVTLAPTRAGNIYTSGETLTVTASATDNIALARIRLTFNGQGFDFAASPATKAFIIPSVAADAPFDVLVEAFDVAGNRSQEIRSITAKPLVNAIAPTVRFDCPTAGAILPSAFNGLNLQVTATDDIGVARVDYFLGTSPTPFATATATTGNLQIFVATVPAGALPTVTGATVVRFRARAYDASTPPNSTETFVDVTVLVATELSATGPNDWPALTNAVTYLATGTLVLDAPRTLGGLLVLGSSTVTHSAASTTAESRLDLTINGPLYVACGAKIDVKGKGYLGGPSPVQPGRTYPNTSTGGSSPGSGGSHGGAGKDVSASQRAAATFGSFSDPLEPGGGGGSCTYCGGPIGGAGGGVVKITAGAMTSDGTITADGDTPTGGDAAGGAGGSIRLVVTSLSGSGTIRANGAAGGAGGRVSVVGQISGVFRPSLAAIGSNGGAAGTIHLKAPGQSFGDLVIDNGAAVTSNATELVSVGSGTVTAGSASGVTLGDGAASWRHGVQSVFVDIRRGGALVGRYRVSGVSADGKTLTLIPPASGPVGIQVGDSYRGVQRIDGLTVKGGARLTTADEIEGAALTSGGGTSSSAILAGRLSGTSFEVNGGALSLNAPAFYDSVSLTNGAALTHEPATTSSTSELNLNVAGALTIDATSRIDVKGKGYLGGPSGAQPGRTYPNTATGGSAPGSGGSHGGGGKDLSTSQRAASTFGSLIDPLEPGGGGGSCSYCGGPVGGAGGGIVKISAGAVSFDGTITADGDAPTGGDAAGGAGGSIRISAASLNGGGVIRANGATGGAGGRIAVTGQLSTGPAPSFTAIGVAGGAAGTIYLKGPGQTNGELVVDNASNVSSAVTDLVSVGAGTVTAASGVTLTNAAAAWRHGVQGVLVDVKRGATAVGRYRVVGVSADGKTLTLDGTSNGQIQVNDTYQGVQRFDRITARNRAYIRTTDLLEGTIDQDATSTIEIVATLAGLSVNPSTVPGGAVATGRVTLSWDAPATGATVALSSSATSVATVPASVVVPGGARSATFNATSLPTAVAASAVLTATYQGLSRSTTLSVTPGVAPSLIGVSLSPGSVPAGAPTTGTVYLSGPALVGGHVVSLVSANPAMATVPASGQVTVPAGSRSATFAVTTSAAAPSGPVEISGTLGTVTRRAPLTLNPAGTGAVTGSVADLQTDFGLSALVVVVGNPGLSTTTDVYGSFSLAGLSPGSYQVQVSSDHYAPGTSATVSVSAGGVASVGRLRLTPNPGSISNRASDPFHGGVPLPGVSVTAVRSGATATTDGAGNFTVTGISPGAEYLVFRKAGYTPFATDALSFYPGAVTNEPGGILRPLGSQEQGVLRGRVRDGAGSAVSGALVTVIGEGSTSTSADGSFAFTLQRGSYVLKAEKAGYQTALSGSVGSLNFDSSQGASWQVIADVTLHADAATADVLVSTYDPVLNAPGSGQGAFVTLQGAYRVTTTSDGRLDVPVKPGLVHSGRRWDVASGETLPIGFNGNASVPATSPRWAFGGDVFDRSTSRPIAGATVTMTHSSSAVDTAQTDAAGRFAFRSRPVGDYTATVSAPGFVAPPCCFTFTAVDAPAGDVHLASWGLDPAGVNGTLTIDSPAPNATLTGDVASVAVSASLPRADDYIDFAVVYIANGEVYRVTPTFSIDGRHLQLDVDSRSQNGPATITVYATTKYGVVLTATRNVTLAKSLEELFLEPGVVPGGASTLGTIRLAGAAPAGGLAVSLSSSSPSAIVPSTVVIPAGASRGYFTVTTLSVGVPTTVTVSATVTGGVKSASLNLLPAGAVTPGALYISPYSVPGGAVVTGTVYLSAVAPAGGVTVSLGSTAPAVASPPASVFVAGGQRSATFAIPTNPLAFADLRIFARLNGVERVAALLVSEHDTASIVGHLVDGATGLGLDATVSIVDVGHVEDSGIFGAFEVGGLSPGMHQLRFEAYGYGVVTTAPITVTAGQVLTLPTINLTAEPKSVTGVVLDPFNGSAPLAGVTVTAVRGGQTTTTAGDGSFTVTGLQPGIEYLFCRKPGYTDFASGPIFIDREPLYSSDYAFMRPIAPDSELGVLHGTVKDSQGMPVAGVTVQAVGRPGVLTAGDGTYAITAPRGSYVLRASKNGYRPQFSARHGEYEPTPTSWQAVIDFVLPASDATGTISFSSIDTTTRRPARGGITLHNLQGSYTVIADDSGFRTITVPAEPIRVFQAYRSPVAANGNLSFVIPGVDSVPAASPHWSAGGFTFRKATGAPVPGATVTFNNLTTGFTTSVTSDANGRFLFASGPVGHYRATATAPGLPVSYPWEFDAIDDPVTGNNNRSDFDLAASDEDGSVSITSPVAGASVSTTFGSIDVLATLPRTDDYIVWANVSLSSAGVSNVVPVYQIDGRHLRIAFGSTIPLGPLTISVEAGTTSGALLTATQQVSVDSTGAGLSGFTVTPAAVFGGSAVVGRVTLSGAAPAGGAVVELSSDAPAVASPQQATVTVPEGATSATIAIDTTAVASPTPVLLNATYAGVQRAASLAVMPFGISSISFSPASVAGGTASTGTVTLNAPAPVGGSAVAVTSSNPGVASSTGTVSVAEGQLTASFPIGTTGVVVDTTVAFGATLGSTSTRATLEVLSPELTEGNAASWSAFASDSAAATVADDVTRVQVGTGSILFTTASSADTGVRYPASGDLHWNLGAARFFTFWAYAENANAFQGPQPVLAVITSGGTRVFSPQTPLLTVGAWRLFQIPLTGDSGWDRSDNGTPDTGDVLALELHFLSNQPNGATFRVTLDGARFTSALPGELGDGTASGWGTFADDEGATSVTDDSNRYEAGVSSLRFTTASGSETGVTYPADASAEWSLTDSDTLSFREYAVNPGNPWQDVQPVVVLNTPTGSFRYTPNGELMTNDVWHQYQIPLAGGGPWTRTVVGTPSLAQVNQLEIRHDTYGYGFDIWFDGLTFGRELPSLLGPRRPVAGGLSVTATVTLAKPAPPGGAVVQLTSSNPAVAQVPASITIPEKQLKGTFTISTRPTPVTTTVVIKWTYGTLSQSTKVVVQGRGRTRESEASAGTRAAGGGARGSGPELGLSMPFWPLHPVPVGASFLPVATGSGLAHIDYFVGTASEPCLTTLVGERAAADHRCHVTSREGAAEVVRSRATDTDGRVSEISSTVSARQGVRLSTPPIGPLDNERVFVEAPLVLDAPLRARAIVVRAGSVLRAGASGVVELAADEEIFLEAGARIDAPGGRILLKAPLIVLAGEIAAEGGTVRIAASRAVHGDARLFTHGGSAFVEAPHVSTLRLEAGALLVRDERHPFGSLLVWGPAELPQRLDASLLGSRLDEARLEKGARVVLDPGLVIPAGKLFVDPTSTLERP